MSNNAKFRVAVIGRVLAQGDALEPIVLKF